MTMKKVKRTRTKTTKNEKKSKTEAPRENFLTD